jgi:hypothetical protein
MSWRDKWLEELRRQKERLDQMTSATPPIEDVVPAPYRRELEALTSAEAFRYLQEVDDQNLSAAYLVLSKMLDRLSLGKVCVGYISRPNAHSRLIGVSLVGSHLRGTRDKEAIGALQRIIDDPTATNDLKGNAQSSINLINAKLD